MNNKNLVSDCPGGGVHGNPIWPMDYGVSGAVRGPSRTRVNRPTDTWSKHQDQDRGHLGGFPGSL